ncbi:MULTISPECIES: nucleoside 2-deoxyribosyltransferase [Caulobacter]|jgi:nucleoside 2-deoxyribosyltransferase|uniref:Nucleoside 2-deoxyribosyltransferase n=1 Tax=Caulobacter vibrioides OR37 TaxID=1292034 RepID=R0EG35_CAUVI|nr:MULTISPECIES: nucleoside 2-deoxyribosyltransferase [Caulobacter]ENZ80217.1 nucleoside 2-deoxyribosyltransferase [Caulobacter vibrioides OR37]MBQ1562589.1 nucleoside 2-deoxyribosyltransferase [Caulobacter sp.]
MRPVRSLWLAGPEAWLPDTEIQAARQRALCLDAGLEVIDPARLPAGEGGDELEARHFYAARMAQLRQADAAIVNLTPFRGPSADTATVFEAGVLAGLGKPIFAYLNVADETQAEYVARVDAQLGATLDENRVWRDGEGCAIEDHGLPETVMLWGEARRLFVIVTQDPLRDLTGLELCLEALALYAE